MLPYLKRLTKTLAAYQVADVVSKFIAVILLPVYTRYVAVSVTRLLGLYSQNDMSWLRTRRLVARVGDSIFLFDMDRPAATPFYQ